MIEAMAEAQASRRTLVERLRSAKEGHAKVAENVRECGPAWYRHRGKIEEFEFQAAMMLRADWEAAGIAAGGAIDPRRAGIGMWRDLTDAQLDGIDRLCDALAAVGKLSGAIAIRWCCEGHSMAEIEASMGWPNDRGYGITRMREALGEFAVHYRLTQPRLKS